MSIPWFTKILSNGLEEKTTKARQLTEIQGNRLHASTTSYRMVRCQHQCVHCPSWCFKDRATRRDLRALEYEDKITPEIRDKIDAIADFKPELTKVQDNVDQMRGKWQ
ncbi:hypothetical protein GN958_ATG17366 [Phytophthora infestans]|uniref:Uncharacterized protein n=1 Tax=Phytophthora infestans TaxID=4787 RepID=A0A8S9U267_PHYIN|nr:hypothetical protein GN958_ATG17366 [Phytophthora infestans]